MIYLLGVGPQIWQLNQGFYIYCDAEEARAPRRGLCCNSVGCFASNQQFYLGGSYKIFYEGFPLLLA